jgi:hypothetical protein
VHKDLPYTLKVGELDEQSSSGDGSSMADTFLPRRTMLLSLFIFEMSRFGIYPYTWSWESGGLRYISQEPIAPLMLILPLVVEITLTRSQLWYLQTTYGKNWLALPKAYADKMHGGIV